MTTQRHENRDRVIKEFPAIGSLRVRLLETRSGQELDVREYVSAVDFEGFTRRGIRLNMAEAAELAHVLDRIYDQGGNPRPAPAPKAAPVTTPEEVKTMTAEELQAAFDAKPAPKAPEIVIRTHSAGPVVARVAITPDPIQAAKDAQAAREAARAKDLENQRAAAQAIARATHKAPKTSILPQALVELRERMRRGETVSLSELAEAMKGMKPKTL